MGGGEGGVGGGGMGWGLSMSSHWSANLKGVIWSGALTSGQLLAVWSSHSRRWFQCIVHCLMRVHVHVVRVCDTKDRSCVLYSGLGGGREGEGGGEGSEEGRGREGGGEGSEEGREGREGGRRGGRWTIL